MRQTDSKCYIIVMLTGIAFCLVSFLIHASRLVCVIPLIVNEYYFSCVYICLFAFINFRLKYKCFIKGLFYMFFRWKCKKWPCLILIKDSNRQKIVHSLIVETCNRLYDTIQKRVKGLGLYFLSLTFWLKC